MNVFILAIVLFAVCCVGLGMNLSYVKLWPELNVSVRCAPRVEEARLREERLDDSRTLSELGSKRDKTVDEILRLRAAMQRLSQDDDVRLSAILESLTR